MEQPFPIYGSTDGGRSLARRPIVLARIPHIGAQFGAVAESAPVGSTAPTPAGESQPDAFSPGTRFYVDSQHTLPAPAEPEMYGQAETQSQAELPSRTPSHRRRHKAHGQPLPVESSTAGSRQSDAATGLSRFHEELATYSSLIVILVLVASGALLYWMIIAPNQAPIADYGNSYETFGSTRIEIPEFTPPITPPAMSPTERQFTLPSEVSAPPETTAESAPELIHVPEQTPAPSDEPEPVFNDASAQAYPVTDYPDGWDLVRLPATDVAEATGTTSSAESEMAQRATPSLPTPVNR